MTPEPGPEEPVCSGVVTLTGMKTVMFLAELNDLKLWNTNISSAYLEAYTSEHVVIIAGPEFGEQKGHIFIIRKKTLYGLRFSGKLFGELLFEVLDNLRFTHSKASNHQNHAQSMAESWKSRQILFNKDEGRIGVVVDCSQAHCIFHKLFLDS